MTTIEFLCELRRKEIHLWTEGDRLRYRAPQGMISEAIKSELSSRRAEIVSILNGSDGFLPRAWSQRLVSVSREKNLPLSFAQQRLWFLDQLEPGSSVYNISRASRLRGPLNVSALEQSLNELIRRHEALRTTFAMIETEPVQIIAASVTVSLAVIDLTESAENQREAEAQQIANRESREPFDLNRGPLLRAKLIRLGEGDYVFILSLHHIISDGWSMGVLYRELSLVYEAFANGQPSPLPDLKIQYADYAVWQREWLRGETLESQLSYWRKQLEDIPTPINLPTDRPRPALRSYRGARQSIELSREVTQGLKALSRSHDVTLYMTLLAAFQTLLCRYTGQEDIAVGSPIANRNRIEIESLIGFFVNTLVMRSDLSGNPPFRELLLRVREVALDAYAHQDLPFEKLVEELHPERNTSVSPLFQVMFVLQNAPAGSQTLAGMTLGSFAADSETAKFDLTLSMREEGGRLRGSLQYNTDLFDALTIQRMLGHFEVLLESIVGDPEQRVSELPLLTEAEKRQLLVEWNDTHGDYPKAKCIHELFEAQVERTPDAIAVVCDNQQLTYRELNSRANQLAHYLRKLAVGSEVLVGLCLERSVEMIVSLLAVLKTGGAYVPLDPDYPEERLSFMLDDAQVAVLVSQENLPRLSAHPNSVVLNRDWPKISAEPIANPDADVTPDNLAYVIYTSGSTGKPKGTLVTHHNVVRLFQATQAWFGFNPSDTWTLFHSCSFDFSVWEIWGALLHGGRLVTVPREITRSPEEFASLIIKHDVTVLNQTPSAFRQLIPVLTGSHHRAPNSLRYVIFGGEALEPQTLIPWFERYGDNQPKLINMYGITETTVHVSYRPVTRAYAKAETGSVIGKPLPDLRVYLLDQHQSLVPVGVPGEIYVGGAGVARGYLNRPELTANKFIYHSFDGEPVQRLYRSGDLARYLPDGNIEFLGRIDSQVKIRGYRIELGEVESVLGQHRGVRESAVIVREDNFGDRRLVAYIVLSQDSAVAVRELRTFLTHKLPDYMIPSAFVFLDSLPLTANGKVDRRALPAPDQNPAELEPSYHSPRTPVQELLAEIWSEVLKLERVGIHNNFFDLGGHSLLATQVISRIRSGFQVEIPLRALFESPTVAGLAERIEEIRHKEQRLQSLPLFPIARNKDLPLSFAQQRLWFLDQLEPGSAVYNIPGAVRLAGPLNVTALEQSLNELIRRHEALRTTFSTVNGEPVQTISARQSICLDLIDLSFQAEAESDERVRALVNEEARRPFNLSQGPLLRVALFKLEEQAHILVLTLHHIVSDGWSMGVLYRELSVLYRAFSDGEGSPLPPLTIQYADYAVWQREWLRTDKLLEEIDYWKKQLDGAPRLLQLPTDHPRPSIQTHRGERESRSLPSSLSESIRSLSRKENATLFMTLLAAFSILLQRYTGEDDIVVGTPIAGRNRQEFEGLIGFFLNHLVLRIDLSGHPTFSELLHRVRDMALGAYIHQHLPFERLLEELQPQRDLSRAPLFQVYFNVLELEGPGLDLRGTTVERIPLDEPESKFDLTLYVKPDKKRIHFSLVYNPSLFSRPRMVEMLAQLEQVLAQSVDHPDIQLDQLSLVTPAAVSILPNPTYKQNDDWQGAIQERLSQQARIRPGQSALLDGWEPWNYETLDLCSNQLANYLRAGGIQVGSSRVDLQACKLEYSIVSPK